MKKLLPKSDALGKEGRGIRPSPEPPRLVAKVCEEDGRGELWLGPLPTKQTIERILDTKPSIQIFCFDNLPYKVQAEPDGEWGMFIPGTKPFRFALSSPQARMWDIRALQTCLVNSLRQGDNAYVHCTTGISKGPNTAALLGAILMRISFNEALSIVEQACSLERSNLAKWEIHMLNPWMNEVLQAERRVFLPDRLLLPRTRAPTGYARLAQVFRPPGHGWYTQLAGSVHATTLVEGNTEPICSWKRDASFKRDFERDSVTARNVEEAANRLGGRFCSDCEAMLKASVRVQVDRFFG
jgi:hypothetical protein